MLAFQCGCPNQPFNGQANIDCWGLQERARRSKNLKGMDVLALAHLLRVDYVKNLLACGAESHGKHLNIHEYQYESLRLTQVCF